MRVLVCGSSGCIGSAVVRALRWRGHRVVATRRAPRDGENDAIALDFAQATSVAAWATRLAALDLDAIVNCAGTALPGPASALAERLHGDGPAALFRGAARAGVARIVNVSALGVDRAGDPVGIDGRHDTSPAGSARRGDGWDAKRRADDALLALDIDAVVVRPALVHGPGSRSMQALAALARAPIQALPGGGGTRLQPLHVFELAEAIAALVERTGAAHGVYELGGADVVSYRGLLAALREASGAAPPLSLAVPMPVARLAARIDRWLACGRAPADVLRLLERDGVAHRNAAAVLLGRAPSTLAEALLVTPPARAAAPSPRRSRGAPWLHHPRGVL